MDKKGKIVSLTGIDGSGKSTQIEMVRDWLESQNYKCAVFKISSRKTNRYKILKRCVNKLAEEKNVKVPLDIRAIILAFENLIKLDEDIDRLLEEGYIVITDRYVESTDIYLETLGVSNYWPNELLSFVPKPDVYIYIDVPPNISYERIIKRNEDINPHENLETLIKLRNGFLDKKDKYGYTIVNGVDSQDVVFERIKKIINEVI